MKCVCNQLNVRLLQGILRCSWYRFTPTPASEAALNQIMGPSVELDARLQAYLLYGPCLQLMQSVPCRVYRVAHGADIIPYLPPKLLEYEDVGPEIFITSTGRILFNQKVSLLAPWSCCCLHPHMWPCMQGHSWALFLSSLRPGS